MKIALVQLDIEWESKKANLETALIFIEKAAHEKCDVTIFPEMFYEKEDEYYIAGNNTVFPFIEDMRLFNMALLQQFKEEA